jgi:hypothetical protein
MRRRVATLIAMSAIAAIAAVSDAAQPAHAAMLTVTVKPSAGSARTHFAVSFRAALSTGPARHVIYRITAAAGGHGGCQAGAAAQAPPTTAGSTVRVALSPSRPAGWCAGTFRGQVWEVFSEPCPIREACPAIQPQPAPQMVGKFSLRVTRG